MKACINLNNGCKAGSSLIEVMIAVLLLAILSIGTVGSVIRLQDSVGQQGHKRAAVAAAHRRMEEVRSELYLHFHDEQVDGIDIRNSWVYLSYNGMAFNRHANDPESRVNVNGVPRTIRTRVRFVDTAEGSYAAAECLEIEVSVATMQGQDIMLRSLYAN